MLRVLIVEHKTVWGGGQVAIVNVLQEWQRTHSAIAPHIVCQTGAELASRVRALGFPCQEMDLGRVEKSRGIRWNLLWRGAPTLKLLETIRQTGCDVVYANGAFSYLAAVFAAALARRPALWVEHNSTLPGDSLLRRMVQRATRIVTVSGGIRSQFLRLVPEAASRIEVIHNGVDPNLYCARPEVRARLFREFGWGESTPVVGTVGRLSPEKGVNYFLNAAAQIACAIPASRFLIVGEGPQRGDLERLAEELELADRVRFLGLRRDVPALLQCMDVVAMASLNEGLPLAVLEAMASARPVVATDVGGVQEIVEDGVSGVLVRAREPGAMGRAVHELLEEPARRQNLGAAARARVLEHFTLARQASRTQTVLESMVTA
jgi:glycosyltransferase involved in cell wall biosynthesis